ncbi:MAG: hypothetical protein JSU57_01060 [Candidatus Heimdallarchaeota archaeon]|nr:MAG: hypothetical protein JSU57_01060 [Candidatus Heimdallarchaeota archaeon]
MKKLGGLAKGAAKEAMSTALNTAVKEIIEETGAKEIAKEKALDAGKKILGDKNVPTKQKVQKEILKTLIKKELGL